MPTPLPVIRGASTAIYPFSQTFIAKTMKSDAQSSNTARYPSGPPVVRFEFPYDQLKLADKNTLKSAFTSAKGQFTTNLSAAFGGTTYTDLSFDADMFEAAEQQSTQYGVKWIVTQTLPQNFSPAASGGAFPTLSTGAICQLPYAQQKRFQSIVSKVASGPKYTFAQFGAGLTGFPTDGLMSWQLTESRLSDAEVLDRIAHFLANWGDAFAFTFKDEDGTTYSHVYYASPELTITRTAPNQASIKTALVQMS